MEHEFEALQVYSEAPARVENGNADALSRMDWCDRWHLTGEGGEGVKDLTL